MRHHRPVTRAEVRAILVTAALSATTSALALALSEERDPLGHWTAPALFTVGAIASAWCSVTPSRTAIVLSALGLVAGFTERALVVPVMVSIGELEVSSSRAWLGPGVYGFIAALVAFVWARVLQPIVLAEVEFRRARQDA